MMHYIMVLGRMCFGCSEYSELSFVCKMLWYIIYRYLMFEVKSAALSSISSLVWCVKCDYLDCVVCKVCSVKCVKCVVFSV